MFWMNLKTEAAGYSPTTGIPSHNRLNYNSNICIIRVMYY